MAVSENDLVVGPLTPAAGVTAISLDFYFEQASWLEVYKAGSETPLVLNTDYTVAGAGSSSGVVTLTTAANGTDAYSIYLAVPLQRSSDMQLRGEFKSEPFNVEMDRLWQRLQYHWTQIGRTFRVGPTDQAPGVFSPTPERVLGFDSAGGLAVTGSTRAQVDAAVAFINGLSGASGAYDAAAGTYLSVETGAIVRSIRARLGDFVSVKDFGAVGDGASDDTTAIQAALDCGAAAVFFPDGDYLTEGNSASANTLLFGCGKKSRLVAAGTGNIMTIDGVSGGAQIANVTVRDLAFKGLNNMTTGPLGCGVISSHSEDITVENCHFDSFGPGATDTPSGGAALCFYVGCIRPTAKNNIVENGTGYLNGTDIAVYSAGGDAVIDGNKCLSVNSNGVYTNAATKFGRVIIVNNICKNHTRHGIIPVYAGADTDRMNTIVANNICEDCDSTGIYVNTNAHGLVIANNVVESCSGGGPNGYTLDGGISLMGTGEKICVGNFVRNTGYTTAGVQRTINTSGVTNDPTRTAAIRVSNGVAGLVANNLVLGGSGRGVDLANGANDVEIIGNKITGVEYAGVHIGAINNGGRYRIAQNTIDVSGEDAIGIWHRGSAVVDNGYIDDNTVIGAQAGTNKYGLRVEGNGFKGSLSRNRWVAFDFGVDLQSVATANRLGSDLVMDGNVFDACNVGFRFLSDLTIHAFHTNSVFVGTVTQDINDQYGRNTVLPAISVGHKKMFYRNAAPTAGSWSVGDQVQNTAPAVDGNGMIILGWICVAAGSPGSWEPMRVSRVSPAT